MLLNTLSFLSSRNVNDQVSHPYKTGKIIVLYILIYSYGLNFQIEHQKKYPDKKMWKILGTMLNIYISILGAHKAEGE